MCSWGMSILPVILWMRCWSTSTAMPKCPHSFHLFLDVCVCVCVCVCLEGDFLYDKARRRSKIRGEMENYGTNSKTLTLSDINGGMRSTKISFYSVLLRLCLPGVRFICSFDIYTQRMCNHIHNNEYNNQTYNCARCSSSGCTLAGYPTSQHCLYWKLADKSFSRTWTPAGAHHCPLRPGTEIHKNSSSQGNVTLKPVADEKNSEETDLHGVLGAHISRYRRLICATWLVQ